MRRSGPLRRHTPLRSVGTSGKPKPRKGRPAPVPLELAEMVLIRAGYACDWCGVSILGREFSRQHRRARGAGGRREGAHTPANLIILCGSATTGCHGRAENIDRALAYRWGFAIRGEVALPEETPIWRHERQWVIPGDGVWETAEPLAA
jgi:hypothetical protein